MKRAMRLTALCAATSFDFAYNDYYMIQGRPGFWRKIIDGKIVPDWAIVVKAIVDGEGKGEFFFRDEQALEELSSYTKWANVEEEEEQSEQQPTEQPVEQLISPTFTVEYPQVFQGTSPYLMKYNFIQGNNFFRYFDNNQGDGSDNK